MGSMSLSELNKKSRSVCGSNLKGVSVQVVGGRRCAYLRGKQGKSFL